MRASKTTIGAALVLSAGLALAACSSGGGTTGDQSADDAASGGSTSEEGGAADSDLSFIYLTNDPIGQNMFLESGRLGTELAAETYGASWKMFEGSTEEANRSNLEQAVNEAPDAIVMITFDFEDLAKEFAEANPDQEFVLIDACPQDATENLHCAVFREPEASYLLGYEAGLLTESGAVGSIGAVDIPFIHRYTDFFAMGAEASHPGVKDNQLFIGGTNPFGDPATAKEQGIAMAATGADHVFAVASGSNSGVFAAGAEKGFTSYGVDVNQCPDQPGFVGDGTIKNVEKLIVTEIGKILDGERTAVTSYGLAEGGMDIISLSDIAEGSQCTVMEHPDVVAEVAKVKEQIISGELVLPDAGN